MDQRKALLIVHQESSDSRRVSDNLEALGFAIDRRFRKTGDPLPATMDEHDCVVSLGGPMSANDGEDYETRAIRYELDFIPVVLAAQKPFLGICLGAQLLARVLGARVAAHPQGHRESGYYRIEPTTEGKRYFDESMMFYQWHSEGFDLPEGADLLAQGEIFPVQAFRYGERAFGLQFHPDLSQETIGEWARLYAKSLTIPGTRPPHSHLEDGRVHDPAVERWLMQFMAQTLTSSASS